MIRHAVLVLALAANTVAMSSPVGNATHAAERPITPTRVASAEVKAKLLACSSYPCPAGYTWYYFNDAFCPGHPDTYEAYVEYWNADASFHHDVYGGTATFSGICNAPSSTFSGSSEYTNCVNNSPWNCQQLGVSQSPHVGSQWHTP